MNASGADGKTLAVDRLVGLLLFTPVPLVLMLFTRQPLGMAWSLGIGVVVMVTHRLYARPFALARSAGRCLYCGGSGTEGPSLGLAEPPGSTVWSTCSESHAAVLRRVFTWAGSHAGLLTAGILGSLGVFLVATPLASRGLLGPTTPADTVAFFRLGIAGTVLPLGWISPGAAANVEKNGSPIRVPFPVHIQALIGTVLVLWLFRLVGLLWLSQGLLHVAQRLGFLGR